MYTIRLWGFFVPLCERYIARVFGYNQACHVALEVMEVADFAFGILRAWGAFDVWLGLGVVWFGVGFGA